MSTMQRISTRSARGTRSARSTGVEPLRRTATIVGWLFVATYVTSIVPKLALYPPLFSGTYLTGAGADSRVLWGAFSEALLIIANIGTATAMYTVLKRRHPHLAISFVAARIMESVFIGVGILSVLTVVTLRQQYAGDTSAAGLPVVGDAFVALQEWTFILGPNFVVGVGNGIVLGWMMWRTGLVPRRLSLLGLVGGPLVVLSGSMAVLGIVQAGSAWQTVLAIPEFLWELILGIYLIVKGFRPSALPR
jgi:hypothetical protein